MAKAKLYAARCVHDLARNPEQVLVSRSSRLYYGAAVLSCWDTFAVPFRSDRSVLEEKLCLVASMLKQQCSRAP